MDGGPRENRNQDFIREIRWFNFRGNSWEILWFYGQDRDIAFLNGLEIIFGGVDLVFQFQGAQFLLVFFADCDLAGVEGFGVEEARDQGLGHVAPTDYCELKVLV